ARPAAAAAPAAPAIPAAPPAEERGEPVAYLSLADGTEYLLFEGVNTLGRRSGNQIVLADAFASGRHAEVRCEPGSAPQVVDVGSTNGTFIAGERLAPNEPVTLADGTVVTMGKTPFTFRISAPATLVAEGPAPEGTEPPAEPTAAWPGPGE